MGGALTGRCAVITGAGGGLGRAFAIGFAQQGARVIAADLDGTAARRTVAELAGSGAEALAVEADVSDEASTLAMARAACDAFAHSTSSSTTRPSTPGLRRRPFDRIEVGEWDRVMAVNVRGTWLCVKSRAAGLRAANAGAIVNVASASALSGSPLWAHYVASKGAVIALTRVMARELGADGVRVSALAPGFTLTDASRELIDDAETYGVERGAIKRPLQPQDIVGTALFLAADASAMITEQTYVVDGGRQSPGGRYRWNRARSVIFERPGRLWSSHATTTALTH
jgi:NAD(P)-dependent dehydrogenase (short-subunit alcohol dehydrogenase family)